MHDSKAEENDGRKAAQMGFTETALNIALATIDLERRDVLYVLPASTPDASDFSSSRFDPALELSPYLAKLFSDVSNIGHKRAGSANLYVRGSRSRSGLKSIPASLIILDELEEMNRENIALVDHRADGQLKKQIWRISTPRLPGKGIDEFYQTSSKEFFTFKCPSCSRWTHFDPEKSLKITAEHINDPEIKNSYLICPLCENKLPHENKLDYLALSTDITISGAHWHSDTPNPDHRGFWIPQLYSTVKKPHEIAKKWFKAQNDPAEEQEYYNSIMGVPHVVEGAQITDDHIKQCIGSHRLVDPFKYQIGRIYTMGIDVGKWLHIEIAEWLFEGGFSPDLNMMAIPKIICVTKKTDFNDLDTLMREYQIRAAVIDANPERRKAFEFANRFYGHVKLCDFPNGVSGKNVKEEKESFRVSVDRTSWLDLSLGRFISNQIKLPLDLPEEYTKHIKSPARVYEKDSNGNPMSYYESKDDDHYAFARLYNELALPFAASISTNRNINDFL